MDCTDSCSITHCLRIFLLGTRESFFESHGNARPINYSHCSYIGIQALLILKAAFLSLYHFLQRIGKFVLKRGTNQKKADLTKMLNGHGKFSEFWRNGSQAEFSAAVGTVGDSIADLHIYLRGFKRSQMQKQSKLVSQLLYNSPNLSQQIYSP